jgi:hypothetical protein
LVVSLPNGISKLSRHEREQRGRIAAAKTTGGDVIAARLIYESLKATRELGEAAARLVAAREAQGLPPTITDPVVLDRIACLIDAVGMTTTNRKKKAASASASPAAQEVSRGSGATSQQS